MSLFGKDATSFSHLDLGILCHSSLQILPSSVRLDGKRWWTAIFRSLQRCSIGFKSGLWLGHSRTVTELLWSHSFVILAVEGCSDGWLSTTFSHLPNASLELSHSDLWVLLYLSHQGSSPPIAQFGRTASSRKGSGRPKRLPFKDYGGHCALRNLKCSRIFFVTLARSVPCHNSVSELFRQFLWPHDSHLLWHALWAVRSYIDRCVAFLIKSNQCNQTQLDSNEGVDPSQRWSEEMDSTWVKYMSVTARGLNT